MTSRTLRWTLATLVTLALGFAAVAGAADSVQPTPACEAAAAPQPATALEPAVAPRPMASNWTFEGCFTYFPAGPCRDVFRDESGALWICKACGTTNKPSPRVCSRLTGSGSWCS